MLVDTENLWQFSPDYSDYRQDLWRGKGKDMVEEGSISSFSTLSMAGLSYTLTMRGEGEMLEDGAIPLDKCLEPAEAQLEITPAAGRADIEATPELLESNGLTLLGGSEDSDADHHQPCSRAAAVRRPECCRSNWAAMQSLEEGFNLNTRAIEFKDSQGGGNRASAPNSRGCRRLCSPPGWSAGWQWGVLASLLT